MFIDIINGELRDMSYSPNKHNKQQNYAPNSECS